MGGVLTQYNWWPYQKRKTLQGMRYLQRKGHVKTQQEGHYLQAKERGLRETNPAGALILDFPPTEL